MASLQQVAVFCGSSARSPQPYLDVAAGVGQALAHERIGLVYGGGHTGLMGAVAQAAMEAGGEVTGVIPDGLFTNAIGKDQVTRLELVDDMHARKARMYALADGFIGLPGGLGTLEEVFEAATWTQLGLHTDGTPKTVVLLDHDGFWEPVRSLLDKANGETFISDTNRAIIRHADTAAAAIDLLRVEVSREQPAYVADRSGG